MPAFFKALPGDHRSLLLRRDTPKKNPPGEPGGIKQLKTNYYKERGRRLVRPFAIQEGIDRTDLCVIIFIGFHFIVTVEVLHIGNGVVQL